MRTHLSILAALTLVASLAFAAVQWTVQPKESQIVFIGTQAGAEFEGKFEKFTADIKFDPADLAGSRFDVKMEMASVNSRDGERDETLRSPDLFGVKQFPISRYVADKFTDKGKGQYAATGKLTIRNVTKEVPIQFTFAETGAGASLKGTTAIKRNDFGVGQGEWKDTSTVADAVKVKFTLQLKKS